MAGLLSLSQNGFHPALLQPNKAQSLDLHCVQAA